MTAKVRDPFLAAMACAAAFLGLLVFAYGSGAPAHADAVALHGFTTLDTPTVERLVDPIAHSVDLAPMIAVLAALSAWGVAVGRRRHVVAAIAVVAAADVSSQILKASLAHPRFDAVLGSDQLSAAAFPSGHATSVMALVVAAMLIAPRAVRPTVAVVSAAGVLAVSLSILVLGWHFPSDVLGGMLLATGFGCLALCGLRATEPGAEALRPAEADPRPRVGAASVLEEWAAGAVLAALAGAVAVGVAISRADALMDYARAQTVSTATAAVVLAIGASLVAGFAVLARE